MMNYRYKYCLGYDKKEGTVIIKKLDYHKLWAENPDGWDYEDIFGNNVIAPIYETTSSLEAYNAGNYYMEHGNLDGFIKQEIHVADFYNRRA